MKTSLLVLGGSYWQLAIIEKAKELGFYTIVADISNEAPGKHIADDFFCHDTNDKKTLLKFAKEKDIKIVIAEQTDRVVPIAAYINEHLGLNGINMATALRFTDKLAMRQALIDKGFDMPAFKAVTSINDAIVFAESIGYPIIIKPRSAQASMGVYKITSTRELLARFQETLKYSTDGTILIEKYIGGIQVTAEGICIDSIAHPLAVSHQEFYSFNNCIPRKLTFPPALDSFTINRIREYIKSVVEALGLVDGIFHSELKVVDGIPYLIEVAARGGGNKGAAIVTPFVSGTDIYECLIRKLNGEKVSIQPNKNRAAILGYLDFKSGKVKRIIGYEDIIAHPNVCEVKLWFKEGDEINRASNGANRAGYYILLCQNRDEVIELDEFINQTLKIEYS